MATMTAKYRGKCATTGAAILPGDLIDYKKGRAILIKKNRGSDFSDLYVINGKEFIRNARGLCEDAPCCGCCTF
jgi:hypothetical protein